MKRCATEVSTWRSARFLQNHRSSSHELPKFSHRLAKQYALAALEGITGNNGLAVSCSRASRLFPRFPSVNCCRLLRPALRHPWGFHCSAPKVCSAHFGFLPDCEAMELSGRARIVDGDTLEIEHQAIRIHGIDAAESGQPCPLPKGTWDCGTAAAQTPPVGRFDATVSNLMTMAA